MSATAQLDKRRAKDRRGLRILLWIPCLFLFAQVFGGLVLDYLWVEPRHPVKAAKLAELRARRPAPEILFLGSSRFGLCVNCDVLDSELRRSLGEHAPRTFNAWLPGGEATASERVLTELRRDGYVPKLVVVEVDPSSLAGCDNWLHYHALNLLDWTDVPEAAPSLCFNGRIMSLLRGRLLPLYLHNQQLRKDAANVIKSALQPISHAVPGEPPIPPPVAKDPPPPVMTPQVKAAVEEGFSDYSRFLIDYHLNGLATRRLERLLQTCQREKIPVLLVGVPVAAPARRAYTPAIDSTFGAYVKSLTERYPCWHADWRDRIPDEYYLDGHHTAPEGSIYFSRRFAAKELAPWWRDNAYVRPTALQTAPGRSRD